MQLLALGLFAFGMDSLPFSQIERSASWRHGKQERFGARPANQFLGPGEDTITITGTLVPEIAGSRSALPTLHDMADTGDAHALILGTGELIGNFTINNVAESQSNFLDNGVPRKNDFTITLGRVDG
ncbi:MAG: phage tail protein [Parasphingorhabdus sp.]|nr:phage tail protein [Parasphingorhabdus sp.]